MAFRYHSSLLFFVSLLFGTYPFPAQSSVVQAPEQSWPTLAPDVQEWIRERFAEHGFTLEFVLNQALGDFIPLLALLQGPTKNSFQLLFNKEAAQASYQTHTLSAPEEWFDFIKNRTSNENLSAMLMAGFNKTTIKAIAIHELGHAVHQHLLYRFHQSKAKLICYGVTIGAFCVAFSAFSGGNLPNTAEIDSYIRAFFALNFACGWANAASESSERLFACHYHKQENEADEFLLNSGDPVLIEAFYKFLECLALISKKNFQMCHPFPKDRAARFKKAFEEFKA